MDLKLYAKHASEFSQNRLRDAQADYRDRPDKNTPSVI